MVDTLLGKYHDKLWTRLYIYRRRDDDNDDDDDTTISAAREVAALRYRYTWQLPVDRGLRPLSSLPPRRFSLAYLWPRLFGIVIVTYSHEHLLYRKLRRSNIQNESATSDGEEFAKRISSGCNHSKHENSLRNTIQFYSRWMQSAAVVENVRRYFISFHFISFVILFWITIFTDSKFLQFNLNYSFL